MKYRNINTIGRAMFKWNESMYKYETLSMCIQISASKLKLTCIQEPGLDMPCDARGRLSCNTPRRVSILLGSDGSIARWNFDTRK
jgi:hypothetical protein